MGLLGTLGGIFKGAGRLATGIIPGTLDDRLFETAVDLFGGGGSSVPQFPGSSGPAVLPSPPPPRRPGSGGLVGPRGSGSVIEPSPIDLGPITVDPFQLLPQGGSRPSGGAPANFQQLLMMRALTKSVRSKEGRAIMEAVMSGSINGGPFQETTPVDTPRGRENHSPPGFRTVYVMGRPVAVFKPIASALGLLPRESRAVVTSADLKCFRKADRLGKKFKKLAQNSGYKVTNR